MSYRKPKWIMLRMLLILILVGICAWSYMMFSQVYERVELSHKMVAALLENRTVQAREYARQLGLVQENLDQTKSFLKDIRQENLALKEKIKLLDQLKEMEREIGELRETNAQIQVQMLQESYKTDAQSESPQNLFDFETIDQGRNWIQKFKGKIQKVRNRIRELKRQQHQRRVSLQQEADRQETLLGNNGFLVRDGQVLPMDGLDAAAQARDVKIKVEFVN